MLASTFMDMVLGVDIHFEMVPMPAPVPTPLPNPFVGMVFDPGGLLTGQAMSLAMALVTGTAPKGPVLINCMPATTCGTNAKNSLGVPHILIPPGTAWAPMPKLPKPAIKGPPPAPGPPVAPEGDAIAVFGSPTVTFMGSSSVRMGDKFMSCGEPVRLPSSSVIAIPKGMPVMVGGPPALSISDAVGALLKSKWVAGYLHDLISRMAPGRLRNLLSKAVCFVTGHPVDVATGRVLTDHVDWQLPGPLPLRFERNYSSAWANRDGPLGHGWSHSLDQAVWPERGKIVYLDAEGREIEFDTFNFADHVIHAGETVYEPISRLTLKAVGQRRFEITTHDGIAHAFEPVEGASGRRRWWSRLVRKTARDGATIELEYDREANLAWVRDSAGRQIAFEHDRAGRLVATKLPHPTQQGWQVHTRFAYDAAGDLIVAADPLGKSWRFAYKQHLLVQETNRNGLSFYFAYDAHGEDAYCVRTWGDGGIYDHVIDYDKLGKVTCVTNSLGSTTTYKMNVVGCVLEVIDALGASTKYEYDERTLQKVKQTNPVGGETHWEYDLRGNATKVTGPDGAEVTIDFNERNQPVRAIDPMKGEWQWGYDERGRLVGRIDALGRRVQLHWRADGTRSDWRVMQRPSAAPFKRLTEVTDPSGQQTTLEYDAHGNVTLIRRPDGSERRWELDALGRCTASFDAKGNARRREYDPLGRVIRVREPDGNTRELSYDGEGNVIGRRDDHQDVRSTYQGMGRLASRTQNGITVGFAYDSEERLVGITNEQGFVYRFELGPTGLADAELGFDGIRRQYIRDKAGRVTKVFRAAQRATTYAYDDAGRVVGVQHDTGEAESYVYRLDGELVEATNDAAVVNIERDLLGRIVRETIGNEWVASDYDALGMRVRVRSSKGLDQRIARDALGHAIGLQATVEEGDGPPSATRSWEARIVRDIAGLEIERTLPGGIHARWHRDASGRPITQEVWAAGEFRRAVQYSWDTDDRLKMVIDATRGPTRYEHDGLGNLINAIYEDGHVDWRMPDAVGNLFRTRDRTDRTYGPAGQLLEARRDDGGITRYEYDAEGHLTKKLEFAASTVPADTPPASAWLYDWNGSGRLARVGRPDGDWVEFKYDAFGRRLSKSFRTDITRWMWDLEVPLHEWVATSEGEAERPITWLFDPDTFAPAAKLIGQHSYAIICDHLGVPVSMLDNGGREVWSASIDVVGRLRHVTGEKEDCPFRWPGQYEDAETGLYYNRFRYYDPDSGAYTSQDPIRLLGGNALYSYPSDPLMWVDPLGLAACGTTAAEQLPEMKGMSVTEAEETLAAHGFTRTNPANPRNQRWVHPDGSEAQIHAYGNASTGPFKSGNNAHVHKDIGRHGEPGTIALNDRGIPSTDPAATHIGISNPSDFPTVAGRPHGT